MSVTAIRRTMRRMANPQKAAILKGFFKTGKGEYAEGDVFLGITVPQLRKLAHENRDLSVEEAGSLLESRLHEERLLALLILVDQYRRGTDRLRSKVFEFYCEHLSRINNWDLVDVSAEHIVGAHLAERDKAQLFRWARSNDLWKRRISIVSTFFGIRRNRFDETTKLSGLLLKDTEDLIHKAVGWMLREVGKRDLHAEERFLKRTYRAMPRTMLRYAIERFPERRRRAYLNGTVR